MSALELGLQSPAHLGERARSTSVRTTLTHVPGAVVRGALAAAWITRHGTPTEQPGAVRDSFVALFEGGVRYGPCYAVVDGRPAVPQSLAVLAHKYPPADPTGCVQSVWDEAPWGERAPVTCPDCGSPVEYDPRVGDPQVYRHTSVALGPDRTAVEGKLVTRELLRPTVLRGAVWAQDPGLLEALGELTNISIGGRRTTRGRATVQVNREAGYPVPQVLDPYRIVLRLASPGVFVDDLGRPARDPSAAELEEVLGTTVRVARRWTRWTTVGGWHAASGLPKPEETAVTAGSTYVLELGDQARPEALADLGRRGVGLRRHEGFGDLAPAPVLPPGRAELASDARAAIALKGVKPALVPRFSALLWALVHGDASGVAVLEEAITGLGAQPEHWARPQGSALGYLVALPPERLAAALNGLGWTEEQR